MTPYDRYVFFLCLVVFVSFTVTFSVMIAALIRFYLRLIKVGAEDKNIKIEYEKAKQKKGCLDRTLELVGCAITFTLSAVMLVAFIFATFIHANENKAVGTIPSLKVVMSSSMSYKDEGNKHLFEHDLNDQVNMFDLVLLRQLPAESEIELYDIVAYERNGQLILHRIVGIEEPNEKHPDQRYFLLQGDAVHLKDKFPVLYEDMRGIYCGERVEFVGSFFVFMRSPAGFLCILLIAFACIATPIAENKIKKAKDARYAVISSEEEGGDGEDTPSGAEEKECEEAVR